jgi:hypothetical protein
LALGRRSILLKSNTSPASLPYWAGVIAGWGFGVFVGYALHQSGLVAIKPAFLLIPCFALVILGQVLVRRTQPIAGNGSDEV